MSVEDLRTRIRPELARASPYRWQEGIPDGPVDRFDMNTPADAPAWYPEAIARLAAIPPNDYPDASYLRLKRAIAGYAGVAANQVVVGAGCDEVLALCAQLALGRGDRALVAKPTYQLYTVASRNAGAEVLALDPVDGLSLARDELVREAAGVRLVWLCSPNNPTGEQLDAALVARICATCPGIVVLDQAYLELGGEDLSGLVAEHENLVVTRTFSKGFALGAARVGYGLAQPALAEALDALRPPGSVSSWSAAVAELACHEVAELHERCGAIIEERGWLAARMRRAGVEVLAHAGNFVLARSPVPDVFDRLVERGCAVRTFTQEPLLADCFRATVSHRSANERLLRALAELAGGEAPESSDGVRGDRIGEVRRATRETRIDVRLGLLGGGRARVATGLGFLDHMLTSFAFWSLTDLELRCTGDLWVDEHHTVEDCAIALGEALDLALGDRAGVRRFGSARAPLDEALAEATVDLSGRGIAQLDLALAAPMIGRLPSALVPHFFDSFARRGRLGLHVNATGDDAHHVTEAAFKAVALALREAVEPDAARSGIASTKGVL
ncbi:MAG TPA: aminotransferase class I/II-fold pyridoxal phosphate-dependent enzyme [Gaiellales bacterium]|jgi:histidinol-phosphate aminotransferase|nr:aminotransferase class I/II-fold pyridoxal phosphate-dependent enzyme [Gaiellales bacterium]